MSGYSVREAPFHPDFPPKELLDVCDEGKAWRQRGGSAAVHAGVAEWYRNNVPAAPGPQTLTDDEKEMLRWGVAGYIEAFKAGRVTCAAYVGLLVKRLTHYKCLNSYLVTSYDETQKMVDQARAVDEKASRDGVESVGPLYGLPVAMKGTAASADFKSSAGTGILAGATAKDDAAMIKLLKSRHAVIMGLTNVPEFACSFVTTNHTNGQARNPHDFRLSPGGSSGGSGVSVAARLVPLSVSEDTGGSTRHPASMNGIFGYDPVRNHYPNEGNPGMTCFCDQVGLHARSLDDILVADEALNGHVDAHTKAKAAAHQQKLRIAFPKEYFVNYTIPSTAPPNAFGLVSLRASQCVREALDRAQAVLHSSSEVEVVNKEWHDVQSDKLGKVNALYHMHFGYDINGKHFEPFVAQCHPLLGNMATWTEKYLDKRASVGDIVDDCRACGASHNPTGFMLTSTVTDESQFRACDYQAFEAMQHWNRFFDENNIDMILVPTQFSPACRLDELAEAKAPVEKLQPDGTYKLEHAANVLQLNIPILLMFKHFPVPKLQIPVGRDAEGRTIGVTLFGRSMQQHSDLFDDAHAQTFDIDFLHKAKVVVDILHADPSLQRVEPALNNDVM